MKTVMDLIADCERALDRAKRGRSSLPETALNVSGMSSPWVRHLLNNLCASAHTFVEVGSYHGSTLLSAMLGNPTLEAHAIEHWRQYGGRQVFDENMARFNLSPIVHVDDFRNVLIQSPIDVFFYDGAHDEHDQYEAICHFSHQLRSPAKIIVDDWNWERVQSGTKRGMMDSRMTVHQSWELLSDHNGDLKTWWNGLFLAVVTP